MNTTRNISRRYTVAFIRSVNCFSRTPGFIITAILLGVGRVNWVPNFSGEQWMQAALLVSAPMILTLIGLFVLGKERTAIVFGMLFLLVIVGVIVKLRG